MDQRHGMEPESRHRRLGPGVQTSPDGRTVIGQLVRCITNANSSLLRSTEYRPVVAVLPLAGNNDQQAGLVGERQVIWSQRNIPGPWRYHGTSNSIGSACLSCSQ